MRPALLRHDQHFAVGIVEKPIGHRSIGGVDVNPDADLRRHVAIAARRDYAFDEIGGLLRNGNGAPTQLARRRIEIIERSAPDRSIVDPPIGSVYHRGLDAIGPGAGYRDAAR